MFSGLFSYDNGVMKFFRTIGYIWYLHFLWLVTSLPVVTIGASTTALCYAMMKLHKEEGYPTENFFHSFKLNLKQATVLGLIYLLIGAWLAANLVVSNTFMKEQGRAFWIAAIVVAVPYLLSLVYVFAVQARFVNTIPNTIKYAFGMAFKNRMTTIQMVILLALVIYLNCTWVISNFIMLVFGVGLLVYLLSFYYNKVFEPYLKED